MAKKKLLTLFFALVATTAIEAGNTITYTATEKLTGHNNSLAIGEATFGSPIISHAFNNGVGTITCNGEITTIRSSAFENCYNLTSVTIPHSVTTIGEYAFCLCKSMTSITIPNSVTSIESYAFRYCYRLTSIEIPNSVTSIGWFAFEGCSDLTSIEIPNSITAIQEMTFKNCSRLKSITIPNSVTSIGSYAFFECYNLISITIPNSITVIGDHAFSECSCLTSITIPNSITKIGSEVFSGCYRLTSVTIPNSVTTIGYEAFKGCSGLISITIPNSVTRINANAFSSCKGLTSIEIPNSVTTIGYRAFSDCSGLTSISIPNSVTTIGEHAFSRCEGLTSVTIPNSITTIENRVFDGCKSLTSIEIPNSVTTIKDTAFGGCSGLISLTIPNSVKEIGKDVFKECSKLETIYDGSGILANNKYRFGINSSCKVYDGVVMGDYVLKSDTIITNYIGNETSASIPNSITTIGNNAFYGCTGLTSVAIPTSVTTIGDNAFYGCTGLTSVAIPTSVTTIGDNAFYGCTGLTSVAIPTSVTTIGNNAFYGCSIENLYCSKKVDLGNTAKYIKHIYRLADEDLIAFFPFATYAIQYITPRINEWQKKGELEKTSDWQTRVTETTRKQKVGEYLKEAQNIYMKAFCKLRTNDFTIDTYDSDNEVYLVRDKEWGNILISVPINEAQYVRQKWSSCKTTPHYTFAGNEVILQSVDFTFPNKKTYTYKPSQNLTYAQTDIQYNFDPIELNLGSNTGVQQPKGQQTIQQKQLTIGKSAVDTNIPKTNNVNDKTFIVILANEDYESVASVPFAKNDGNTFKKYCINTLGIPEKNIHLRENATLNNMRSELGWLKQVCEAYKGEASVIFYYAGHGIPDENDKSAYLLPSDGDGRYVQSGYKLDDLYSRLGSMLAKSITVFMDACFSGSQRGTGMLASARGVALKSKAGVPQGNMVVFSAAQGDETAYPNNNEGHGMFTYYLLKKLQETKGDVTLKDLGDYITTNVSQQSIVLNSKSQTPCVTPASAVADSWQTWKLR